MYRSDWPLYMNKYLSSTSLAIEVKDRNRYSFEREERTRRKEKREREESGRERGSNQRQQRLASPSAYMLVAQTTRTVIIKLELSSIQDETCSLDITFQL